MDSMFSRRSLLRTTALATAAARLLPAETKNSNTQLAEFGYGDVSLAPSSLPEAQFRKTQATVQSIDDDSMLKPFRLRAGLPDPGPGLAGWYDYFDPSFESDNHTSHAGFCPGHAFGQWISSFARTYAADRDPALRARIQRVLALYAETISPAFYKDFRFPAYVYDKLNIGLIDAYRYADISEAKGLFARTTEAASAHLPPRPLNGDEQLAWRRANGERTSVDFAYDESYTLPENLFLATSSGLGNYRAMASKYVLDKTWFDPLSQNQNVLDGKHAYSYCNSLSSGVQAYFDTGNRKYLDAVTNAFRMISEQSFVTGGWGADEQFGAPGSGNLYRSLSNTSRSFETPCGFLCPLQNHTLSAAHFRPRILWRQPGARPLQHRPRSQAARARRPHLLLLRLRQRRPQVLPQQRLALLLRHSSASHSRLSHLHVLS